MLEITVTVVKLDDPSQSKEMKMFAPEEAFNLLLRLVNTDDGVEMVRSVISKSVEIPAFHVAEED